MNHDVRGKYAILRQKYLYFGLSEIGETKNYLEKSYTKTTSYADGHIRITGKIKINLDFKRYTKAELVRAFVAQGGDMDEAFLHRSVVILRSMGKNVGVVNRVSASL